MTEPYGFPLRRPRRFAPRVTRCRFRGREAVLKDWATLPRGLRWCGRWLAAREWRLLKRLAGLPGIPEPLGCEGARLVVAYVEGVSLSGRLAPQLPPDFFPRLEALLAAVHARGVVHLDLRQRKNVLLGAGGEPVLLDFATGVDLHRLGPCRFLLGAPLRWLDRWALLKLKAKYAPSVLAGRERRWASWSRRSRVLWPGHWWKRWRRRRRTGRQR